MEQTFSKIPALSRPKWLLGTVGPAVLGSAALDAQAAISKMQVHIVILGRGFGCNAVVNQLHAVLDGVKITLNERKEEHTTRLGTPWWLLVCGP